MKIVAYRVQLDDGQTFFRLQIWPIEPAMGWLSSYYQRGESVEQLAAEAIRVARQGRDEDRKKPDFGQREREEIVLNFLEHEYVDFTDGSPELRIPLSRREKKRFWKTIVNYYRK